MNEVVQQIHGPVPRLSVPRQNIVRNVSCRINELEDSPRQVARLALFALRGEDIMDILEAVPSYISVVSVSLIYRCESPCDAPLPARLKA